MKKIAGITRPFLLVISILTLLASAAFVVVLILDGFEVIEMDFDSQITFLLSFGIGVRILTIIGLALSLLIVAGAFINKSTRVASIIGAVFSATSFIFNFQLTPICSRSNILAALSWFGGADILTPMVFIALSSFALMIATIVGISLGKSAKSKQ